MFKRSKDIYSGWGKNTIFQSSYLEYMFNHWMALYMLSGPDQKMLPIRGCNSATTYFLCLGHKLKMTDFFV